MPGRRTRGVAIDYRALDGADSDGEPSGSPLRRGVARLYNLALAGKRLISIYMHTTGKSQLNWWDGWLVLHYC